jgi:CheY-like chemotaxis protein
MQPEKNYRILVVDDIAAIHQDFRKVLLKEDNDELENFDQLHEILFNPEIEKTTDHNPIFEIDSAYQSNEALASIKKSLAENKPYALTFVDGIMPPGEDGIETIRRIWEEDPYIQTVICTAFTMYSREEISQRLGKSDRLFLVQKPFDKSSVILIASLLTRKWSILRKLQAGTTTSEMREEAQTELKSIADELKNNGYLLTN